MTPGPNAPHSIHLVADAFMHDLDPVLVHVAGPFAIRWYGLSYLVGFIVAWLILRWMAATKRLAVTPQQVGDYMMAVVVGVLVGGRLGYAAFYDQSLLLSPVDLIKVWDGGMASHGGMIGVILATMWFAHRRGVSQLHMLDAAAFTCPPGLGFGRVANFINGELWGKPIPADQQVNPPWWSIQYWEQLRLFARHDPMKLADMTDVATAAGLDGGAWRREALLLGVDGAQGQEAARLMHGWIDGIGQQVRAGNEQVIDALRPVLTAYYPSQIIQAMAEGVILFAALVLIWLVPRKPGVVGSWFLTIYGVLRVFTELFRQPDEGVAVIAGLQRGQLLSVAMILAGLACLIVVSRRKVNPVSGLMRIQPARA